MMFVSRWVSFATPARFDPLSIVRSKRRRRWVIFGLTLGLATGTFEYKFRECLEVVDNPAGVLNPHRLFFARMLFGRLRSQLIGKLADKELPINWRPSVYSAYAKMTGVNLDEMRYPIDSYRSVQEFFTRPLKKDARPMDTLDPLSLVSPVDGEVIACGDITEDRLPQVKGTSYSLKGFLGQDLLRASPPSSGKHSPVLKYAVLYLCPGDYHRFHSPTSLHITQGKHFSGEVISVNKTALKFLNDIFSVNERVVLSGTWAQGNIWFAAVAAHGVGNIKLSFDNKLRSNDPRTVPVYCGGEVRTKTLDQKFLHGDQIGMFKLGSTVVLIFEASTNMDWKVKQGDKVKVGQLLCDKKSATTI